MHGLTLVAGLVTRHRHVDVLWRHRSRPSSRHLEIDVVDVLDVLRGAQRHLAVRGDQHRVAVEDEFVLPTDGVDVQDRGAGLGGPATQQRQPDVVLVPLVRRTVDVEDEPDPDPSGDRERTAVLPQVLADGQRDIDAAMSDDHELGARDEVAPLVEHPVVGQVMLEVAGHHLAAVQERSRIARAGRLIDVADENRNLT